MYKWEQTMKQQFKPSLHEIKHNIKAYKDALEGAQAQLKLWTKELEKHEAKQEITTLESGMKLYNLEAAEAVILEADKKHKLQVEETDKVKVWFYMSDFLDKRKKSGSKKIIVMMNDKADSTKYYNY